MKPHDFRYIKGLGSLEVDEYQKIIHDPFLEVVELTPNFNEIFEVLYGKNSEPRKQWMSTGNIVQEEVQ